jgi:hypothetical protein
LCLPPPFCQRIITFQLFNPFKVISSFHIGLEILPTQLVALVALSFGAIVS